MQIRPHRIIKRKITKEIKVGNVKVGGNAPISVQSMTNTLTTDIKGTINQIHCWLYCIPKSNTQPGVAEAWSPTVRPRCCVAQEETL